MPSDDEITEWARPCDGLGLWWTQSVLSEALTNARRLQECEYEVFAQGSYANGTNIAKSSDIDLVIAMSLPFEEDVEELDDDSRRDFYTRYAEIFYGWPEFRADVLATLRERFFVGEGDKCIDISDADSLARYPADILPAIRYRRYEGFSLLAEEEFVPGILFRTSSGHEIVNYPKQHLENGNDKDRNTGGRFKYVVRAVKNARFRAKERDVQNNEETPYDPDGAPSYFVECLLYNVPDKLYRTGVPSAYRRCIEWLATRTEDQLKGMACQNGLVDLFGTRPDQWDVDSAKRLVDALNRLCDGGAAGPNST